MNDMTTPLRNTFHFTADDLKINRHKRISGAQFWRLSKQWALLFGGWLLLSLTPLAITGGVLSWSEGVAWEVALGDRRALIGYVIGGLLGLIYALANIRRLLLIVDLLVGRVGSIKGKATLWGRYIIFGKYRFVVEESALAHIQTGVTYRVFILPLSRTPLSIEYAE